MESTVSLRTDDGCRSDLLTVRQSCHVRVQRTFVFVSGSTSHIRDDILRGGGSNQSKCGRRFTASVRVSQVVEKLENKADG